MILFSYSLTHRQRRGILCIADLAGFCFHVVMHLCFVDESGTPAKLGMDKPRFFVMAGVVIPEERWQDISNKLGGLKRHAKYRGELKWRYFAPSNGDKINPMLGWPQSDRDHLRKNVFSLLTSERSISVTAGVCQASLAYRLSVVNDQQDIYFRTYKVVTERFQYLLQDITKSSGHKTLGIIVADHRGRGDDEKMRTQHQRLIEQDSVFSSKYMNLVEGLFLAPSHMSIGIQFADMAAGAIWRRFESNDSYWYDKISSSFRKSPAGTIDGYGIARFPKEGWTGPIP